MMMITATILATGPSMLSRIDCSGASHGIDEPPAWAGTANVNAMTLVVADGQAWWDRAVAAGCRIKMPFAKAPWGDLYGGLLDPFGVNWAINQPVPPG